MWVGTWRVDSISLSSAYGMGVRQEADWFTVLKDATIVEFCEEERCA